MSTLGSRLRWAREAAGLPQRTVSRLAGLKSERHVGLIEAGIRQNVHMHTLNSLAGALGLPIAWLANGKGRMPSVQSIRRVVRANLAALETELCTGTDR